MGVEIYHACAAALERAKLLDRRRRRRGLRAESEIARAVLRSAHGRDRESRPPPGPGRSIGLGLRGQRAVRQGRVHLQEIGRHAEVDRRNDSPVRRLADNYPLWSIEDPLSEDDWKGWQAITRARPSAILVGDDVFVTNPAIIRKAVAEGVGNAVLIKLNQVGTVTETLTAINDAQEGEYATIISHRSGETPDVFIADLAIATGAGRSKPARVPRRTPGQVQPTAAHRRRARQPLASPARTSSASTKKPLSEGVIATRRPPRLPISRRGGNRGPQSRVASPRLEAAFLPVSPPRLVVRKSLLSLRAG